MSAGVPHFNERVEEYGTALNDALRLSGEDRSHFARARLAVLNGHLKNNSTSVRKALDFGCGDGATVPLLLAIGDVEQVIGFDVSVSALEVARRNYHSYRCSFSSAPEELEESSVDLVYCNGVFHHIPPEERSEWLACISRALRPGGLISLWENNPWSPATRLIMSRCIFDRDAVLLSSPEACRLLERHHLEVLVVEYAFVFPRCLGFLRPLEKWMRRLPVGAQYHVLCRRD